MKTKETPKFQKFSEKEIKYLIFLSGKNIIKIRTLKEFSEDFLVYVSYESFPVVQCNDCKVPQHLGVVSVL